MPRLSVCMIVKNEGYVLERCLNNIKDHADEIIIVDTGSTDNTIEIAKRFTDKIFNFEWCDDFSKARNYSLSKATGEWIFILDADEIVSDETMRLIINLISDPDADIYECTKKNRIYEKDIDIKDLKQLTKDSKLPLLFRNNPEIRFRYRIHEKIPAESYSKFNFKRSDVIIYNLKDVDKKEVDYLKLIKIELEEGIFNMDVFHNMLEENILKQDWEELNYFLDKMPKIQEGYFQHFIKFYYALKHLGRSKELIVLLKILINSEKNNAKLNYLLAREYAAIGDDIQSELIVNDLLRRFPEKKELIELKEKLEKK